jgi:hypothetical protein
MGVKQTILTASLPLIRDKNRMRRFSGLVSLCGGDQRRFVPTTICFASWSLSALAILRQYRHGFALGLRVLPRYNSALLNGLVLHQFRKAPRRTCLGALAISVEIMLILTLVGTRYKELPPELKFIEVVISLLLSVVIAASFIYVIG